MLQRRRDGPLQARLDHRCRNGLLQKLCRGNGKAAAFAAAQQIEQPEGHRAALRLDDRGLLLIAARFAQGAHQSAAHFSEIGGLIKAAEHRDAAEKAYAALDEAVHALFEEGNPVGVKCALSVMGRIGDTMRLPLVAGSGKLRAKFEELIARYDLR